MDKEYLPIKRDTLNRLMKEGHKFAAIAETHITKDNPFFTMVFGFKTMREACDVAAELANSYGFAYVVEVPTIEVLLHFAPKA